MRTLREISDTNEDITRRRRCLLSGDVDAVLSDSYEERRVAVNGRSSSIVRLSQLSDDGHPLRNIRKVIHFFVTKFRGVEGMLAYVRIYHFTDQSRELG